MDSMPIARAPGGPLLVLVVLLHAAGCGAGAPSDLDPVTFKPPPDCAPVTLVADGEAKASIAVMVPKQEVSRTLRGAIKDLHDFIRLATGADLPIVSGKADGPAIVIGDCGLAARCGLRGGKMPVEGFAIKTTDGAVLIVGRDGEIAPKTPSDGTAWGIYEFLERFVDVRWYFPGEIGCSVPKRRDLVVAPVWLTDAPHFRKREIWPSGGPTVSRDVPHHHRRLRSADSWPVRLQVHSPTGWPAIYGKSRPECFQLRSDGTRNMAMLCYGHPKTLQTYLETISAWYEKGDGRAWAGKSPVGNSITVSPNDMAIACHCEYCRKLWDPDGGRYGTASKVVAQFVADLAREVRKRWPDKRIIYLPYTNYTAVPEGVTFPDNVEVQLCGMPGLAQYKEPAIAASEQRNIDGWIRLTGRRIQNWHYSCWPEDQTKAAYLFPYTIRDHYRANRDKTVGSFINGGGDHWPRQHVSLYAWMKCLWDPDFNVEFAIEEYCRRMYGPAAATMRRLIYMQIDGWEKSRWPEAKLTPVAIYEHSYPRRDVVKMEALLAEAFEQARGDGLVTKRLEYCAGPLRAFFSQSKQYAEGTGRTPLVVRKVGENPVIDGRLNDGAWKAPPHVSFIRATDRQNPKPRFATTLRAVWTLDGVTFGFRMAEPAPGKLRRDIKGRDDPLAWWNDNVELFLDVAGRRRGYYQLIVNPNGAVYDGKGRDTTWTCKGLKTAAHVGSDFWSLEVYVPYAAFPDATRPGTGVVWYGNFTRHRVADRKPREYQRLNTTYEPGSHNMMAFGPIRFVE
jgi:hypothetical protein